MRLTQGFTFKCIRPGDRSVAVRWRRKTPSGRAFRVGAGLSVLEWQVSHVDVIAAVAVFLLAVVVVLSAHDDPNAFEEILDL